MDYKLLLAQSFTVLWRENLQGEILPESVALVKEILKMVKVSEIGIGITGDRDITLNVKNAVQHLCDTSHDLPYLKEEVLRRFKLACLEDERYFQVFKEIIEKPLSPEEVRASIKYVKKNIKREFDDEKAMEILVKAANDMRFNRSGVKSRQDLIAQLDKDLAPYRIESTEKSINGIVDTIDFGDVEKVNQAFKDAKESVNGTRVYKTGLLEYDEMLQGGVRPGYFFMHTGLQHNYKTGLQILFFCSFAMHNKPLFPVPGKKSLILYLAGEDELINNMLTCFLFIKFTETGVKVNIDDYDIEYITSYVTDTLKRNGWYIKMEKFTPHVFSYIDLGTLIAKYEDDGYNVEICLIDYLYKFARAGMHDGAAGEWFLDLATRTKSLGGTRPVKTADGRDMLNSDGSVVQTCRTFITPHQLSADALRISRQIPPEQFAPEMSRKACLEGATGLAKIYDICIHHHLVEMAGRALLHSVLDKHRYPIPVESWKKQVFHLLPESMMPLQCNYDLSTPNGFRKLKDAIAAIKGEREDQVNHDEELIF